jgi:enoyl-CoA hydratase
MNSQMARELVDAANAIDDDEGVCAVVLTGAGGRAFSVGMDWNELVDSVEGVDDPARLQDIRHRLWNVDPCERWANLTKPTIAAVSGVAFGAGLELALACDIRLAAEDAQFGFPEIYLGIMPCMGGTQRLPRLIGRAKATEMILTGDPVSAAEALRVELVSQVVGTETLMAAALELASKIAEHAPIALRFAREAIGKGLDMTFEQGMQLETDLYALLQTTRDRAEGILSFNEKRKPTFTGR